MTDVECRWVTGADTHGTAWLKAGRILAATLSAGDKNWQQHLVRDTKIGSNIECGTQKLAATLSADNQPTKFIILYNGQLP